MKVALSLIAGVVALLALLMGVVLTAGVGLPIAVKIMATVAMIAPAGFMMGMPFPTGLARLEKRNSSAVRWAWSLNAASSVLGFGRRSGLRHLSGPDADAAGRRFAMAQARLPSSRWTGSAKPCWYRTRR